MAAPGKVTIRAYRVGFGDCFLLTFHYKGDEKRHVLIDFGSSALPTGKKKSHLIAIAEDIKKQVGEDPFAVVASHRHSDHISGFATAKDGKGTGDIIRSCKPDMVVQPWTEDPKLPTDATAPIKGGCSGKAFAQSLLSIHQIASSVCEFTGQFDGSSKKPLLRQLAFIGETNLHNLTAVRNLQTMGPNVFAHHGSRSGIEKLLPDVRVHVLGPPTIKQSPEVKEQREEDDAEFWHLQARAQAPSGGMAKPPFKVGVPLKDVPADARWFIPRVQRARMQSLLDLVRILDDVLNNTSLILLFEVGKRFLLFPGDAQIENWSYVLFSARDKKLLAKLARTNVYKVGHHGSLNATPKSLWKLFEKKGGEERADRLVTILSSKKGKHGKAERGTEVPRGKLVKALQAESALVSTMSRATEKSPLCEVVELDV